jgi:2-polyprenyl-3-methyl-5-hydroxy-6-metoxy-1,4-benzoquinol methylase
MQEAAQGASRRARIPDVLPIMNENDSEMRRELRLSAEDLQEFFDNKYGNPNDHGWSRRRNLAFGYFTAADVYEAMVRKLVLPATRWLDVGGGSAIFPYDDALSWELAKRCENLTAVDPSPNVHDNKFAQQRVQCMFEDFDTEERFDLATFRMVAEHVTNPAAVLERLQQVMSPGGLVVIFTINRYSPVPLITSLTPFSLHYRIKKFFWGGEERDTFPVAYKLNTRCRLRDEFSAGGFEEVHFEYLDDLSVFYRFRVLNYIELLAWKLFRSCGLPYPENNLLGVYRKSELGGSQNS